MSIERTNNAGRDSHLQRRWAVGCHAQHTLAVLAVVCLSLCSCRSLVPGHREHMGPRGMMAGGGSGNSLPPQAFTGAPGDGYTTPANAIPHAPTAPWGIPLPQTMVTPWAPPGMKQPWPHDEYLHDGGDKEVPVMVAPNFEITGLNLEDTVVHYDTIDGQTIVEPSNRVCLYAPRFAAVRKVEGVEQSLQQDQPFGVALPVKVNVNAENRLASTAMQPLQPIGDIGVKQPSVERLRQNAGVTGQRVLLMHADNVMKAYEDFQIIRIGIHQAEEKARLATSIDAAIVWSHDQAVQVILDKQAAHVETGDQRAQATFTVDVPNHPCLRVCKVASKQSARPGEIVDFTIRFDNMGDQTIGNVTLVDNLTTRLELVPDSAQSSRPAEFSTQVNEGDSLVLRWEFTEPLKPGEGGLVRFHCKVR